MRIHVLGVAACLWAGCASEYELSNVDGVDDPDDVPGTDEPKPDDDDDDSPWGKIKPGSRPDAYFAIQWRPNPMYKTTTTGLDQPLDVHWAIIDLDGQVLEVIEPPVEYDPGLAGFDITPAGVGSFDIAVQRWAYDNLSLTIAQASTTDIYRANAIEHSVRHVVHWDWTTEEDPSIVETGEPLDLTYWGANFHRGAWPGDDDHMLVWEPSPRCSGAQTALRSHSLSDASETTEEWPQEALLPLHTDTYDPYVHSMQAGQDADGVPSLLLGLESGCDAFQASYSLATWSPETGRGWSAPIDPTWHLGPLRYHPDDGGAALYTGAVYSRTDYAETWHLADSDGTRSGELDDGYYGYKPVALFDPSVGAFMVSGESIDDGQSELMVYFKGRRVWTIDKFKFGLEKRRIYIEHAVLLDL